MVQGVGRGEVTLSLSSPRVNFTFSAGTYKFQEPVRMHPAPALVRRSTNRRRRQTVAADDFVIAFWWQRRRYVSSVSNGTAVAVGRIGFIVVGVKD